MSGHFLAEFVEGRTAEAEVLPAIKAPKKYKVVLLNDDYTPMDFVVDVLRKFFHFDEQRATSLMLEVHFAGRAICGVYTKDIAETKVAQVNDYARANEHPLLCGMEPE